MVGNKHKNGIICTYPDCNKPMRTQKFKMHFTKAHLREGEVYSVEHRRQYEVAREDNARTDAKAELAPATMLPPTTVEEIPRVETTSIHVVSSTSNAAHEDIQTAQAPRKLPPVQSHQALAETPISKNGEDPNAATSAAGTGGIADPHTSLSAEQTSGSKRPASAMETAAGAVDPTSVLLMQFIALMDQRFQELVGKMGEMIDVQKDLIDTLQASNPNGQAPASAFSHAVEVVMKRRKKDLNTHDSSDSSANSNGNTDANGGNQDGFVL
ncbi:hypothetical protein PHYSODRAFT_523326 [Phytophthora sojae]|uniref:Uncharacterized protein n=1 Tax=Phytophthora sojae (strain P6497) TaxID=1094619 RepID=G5A3E0_PHYSP|nr:hypothetical protein PHYSODRAFT_523326 [Phytophthora sojae]EGZ09365.1 hypothetical protein PHYSODRAFT_523326 [Phytophthora sojae]|eukprot:XP_009534226.1 hypothetical protein PHYSODRAFT_523326 [Phytophthora sojae]